MTKIMCFALAALSAVPALALAHAMEKSVPTAAMSAFGAETPVPPTGALSPQAVSPTVWSCRLERVEMIGDASHYMQWTHDSWKNEAMLKCRSKLGEVVQQKVKVVFNSANGAMGANSDSRFLVNAKIETLAQPQHFRANSIVKTLPDDLQLGEVHWSFETDLTSVRVSGFLPTPVDPAIQKSLDKGKLFIRSTLDSADL